MLELVLESAFQSQTFLAGKTTYFKLFNEMLVKKVIAKITLLHHYTLARFSKVSGATVKNSYSVAKILRFKSWKIPQITTKQ